MKRIQSIDYAYAVGKIRAREARLVNQNRFLRMAGEADIEGAIRELMGTDHEGRISTPFDEEVLERYLNNHRAEIFRLIGELSRDPQLTDIITLRNDFHNLKMLVKTHLEGKSFDEIDKGLFLGPSMYLLEEMGSLIENRQFSKFSHPLSEGANKVFLYWEEEKNPFMIDVILDRIFFGYSKESVKEYGESFLDRMFAIEIDLLNIKGFVRLKRMDKEIEYLKRVLIAGGDLERGVFIDSFTQPWDRFRDVLRYKDYAKVIDDRDWGSEDMGWVLSLERGCENFLTGYVKKAKFISFGIEPLFGYWWAKYIELKNLKNVLMGKLNRFSPEEIKSNLRETYA